MKTKILILILLCAVITLSFTFAATRSKAPRATESASTPGDSAPVGGFVSENSK